MTEQNPTPDDYMLVGEIVAAFGVRGQVKVRSLTDNVEHLRRRIKTVYLGPKREPRQIKEMFEHKPGLLIMQFEGVSGRIEAENLRGTEVAILEKQAVPLGEGEYFIHQLYNLDVFTEDGTQLGQVREVLQTGANDIVVVTRPDKPDALLPMIRDVIINLDIANGRLTVRLLEGLLID